ncbi:MAG: MFS transporter [Oscillospiraceae bacterium]|nr:MFS transporter [Oscillospiraceae bacterium]
MEKKTTNRWVLLLFAMICMLIMGVCYTYSLFNPYVQEHFGVDQATATLPYTIFIAVFVLGNYLGGVSTTKNGLKKTLLIGYTLMVLGWLITTFLPKNMFWGMVVTFGGLFGIGDGMVYNVVVALTPRWFPDRKGLASGLTLAALGLSATIFSPMVSGWLKSFGFRTFMIVAFIYVGVAIIGLLTLKNPPEGYMVQPVAGGGPTNAVAPQKQYEVKEAVKTKEFWIVALLYFCLCPAYLLMSAIFVSYGKSKGLDPAMATLGVSIASLCQVGGRLVLPTISDKIGRKSAFAVSFLVTAAGIALLTTATGALYVACFALLSLSYGGGNACFGPIAADIWGTKNLGTILSLTMIGFGVGSIASTILNKILGPGTAFIVAGVIAVIGVVLVFMLPGKNKNKA